MLLEDTEASWRAAIESDPEGTGRHAAQAAKTKHAVERATEKGAWDAISMEKDIERAAQLGREDAVEGRQRYSRIDTVDSAGGRAYFAAYDETRRRLKGEDYWNPASRYEAGSDPFLGETIKRMIREEINFMKEEAMDPMAILTMMCSTLGQNMLQSLAFDIIDNPDQAVAILSKVAGAQVEQATGMSLNDVVNMFMKISVPGMPGLTIQTALEQTKGIMGPMVKETLRKMVPTVLNTACQAASSAKVAGL